MFRKLIVLTLSVVGWCGAISIPSVAWGQTMSSLLGSEKQIADLLAASRASADSGRNEEAMGFLQQVLTLDPNHVEANFRMGLLFWGRQQIQQSLGYFQRSSDLAPNNASLHLSVGGYFEQVNLLPQALQHYRAALPLLENTPEFKAAEKRTNLALVKDYAARGDMDTSLQLLNSLVEEYPDDARVLQYLGFSYVMANRIDDAISVYRSVLLREPGNDTAHLNLAGAYEKIGDTSNALFEFGRVIELNVDKGRVTEAKARVALINAAQWEKQGNTPQALAELNVALDANPSHPLVNLQLAALYRKTGQFLEAEKAYQRAIEGNPNNFEARLKLAELHLERKNFIDAVWELEWLNARGGNTPFSQQAQAMLTKLTQTFGKQMDEIRSIAAQKNQFKQRLATDRNDVEAHFNLGVILMNQEQFEAARVEFEEVLRLDPLIARAYASLSDIYTQLARFGDAADAILRFISLETNLENVERVRLNVASLLGQKLYEAGSLDAALFQFDRVLSETPDDVLARFYTGLVLSKQGKLEDAAKHYERVIDKVPGHMGARTNLALIYEQLGKEEDALAQYRRIALAAAPGQLKDTAEKRAVFLQRVVNGFTATAGYALNFDNNANLNANDPMTEYASSLNGSLTYRYKHNELARFGMTLTPTYSTYHVGQYDFLTEAFDPFITYGEPEESYTFRYNYTQVSGVLNEQSVNTQQSLSGEMQRLAFGSNSITGTISVREFKSAQNPIFDSRSYSIKTDYVRALDQGANDVMSLGLSYNASVNDVPNPGAPDNEPIQNSNFYQQSVYNYLTGSTEDAEYLSNTLTYQYNKFLTSTLSLGATLNYTYTAYLNPDRFNCDKRENQSYGLSLALNYRFNESIRAYVSAAYTQNESNLPIFVVASSPGAPVKILCSGIVVPQGLDFVPLNSEQLIGVPIQNASLSNYSKATLAIGLGVNF